MKWSLSFVVSQDSCISAVLVQDSLPLSEHFQDRNIFDEMRGPGLNAEFQMRSDIGLVKQSEVFSVQILESPSDHSNHLPLSSLLLLQISYTSTFVLFLLLDAYARRRSYCGTLSVYLSITAESYVVTENISAFGTGTNKDMYLNLVGG